MASGVVWGKASAWGLGGLGPAWLNGLLAPALNLSTPTDCSHAPCAPPSTCSGTFDFFYLPIDFRNRCNLGYAFVNFLRAPDAARLYRAFHQKPWQEYNSKKVGGVCYGRVYGGRQVAAVRLPPGRSTTPTSLVYCVWVGVGFGGGCPV